MKIPDPAEEIRAIKRNLSDACGNDVHRIAEEARRNCHASQRRRAEKPTLPTNSEDDQPSVSTDTTNNTIQPSGNKPVENG